MYKRFWIICLVVGLALSALSGLGLSSLGMHEKGLRGQRQQEFIAVAKQVSFDVKKKVDAFLQTEQARPYTDYQYYYVPQASNEAAALVRSPLGNSISNELAYGYFQLDNAGAVATPYTAAEQDASDTVKNYIDNLKNNLLPSLVNGAALQVRRIEPSKPPEDYRYADKLERGRLSSREHSMPETPPDMPAAPPGMPGISGMPPLGQKSAEEADKKEQPEAGKQVSAKSKADASRRSTYPITLDETGQKVQVVSQSRENYELNVANKPAVQQPQSSVQSDVVQQREADLSLQAGQDIPQGFPQRHQSQIVAGGQAEQEDNRKRPANDVVQVRIEPFVPLTVPETNGRDSVFAGQVFLLRHIQIEDKHFVQGFRLDELELLKQVAESAQQFIRRGMGFEIAKAERADAAFTAVLDFGFGEVVLNLLEQQPGWIEARVVQIRNWFFAILAVVWLAVVIAMAALWRNMYAQVQLARKKDDFISAVSHELRTPLTSIRMYTEMLEKDWVKTEDKRRQYYVTMRQESERLSRLIENVLDFSRIQRGKKQYQFTLGDVNAAVGEVVRMMRPCAERAGFELVQEFGELEPFMFDRDAVMQIVINLLDNALKYANGTQDKRIIIRTQKQRNYVVIEVEDRGPGIARSQHKKIFEPFYRCGDESTRQTTGTGLGLALVKRFAEAHHGFVEITSAKPTGACFRVGLSNHFAK